MADTKITVLGMSGAGKTCFLLGLYYKMSSGLKGYTITTDDDTDVQLRDRYAKMCDSSLGAERFPVGTDSISKYLFDLQYGYNTIMSFDWIDYPGGALDKKNAGNLDDYEDLKKTINDSSCLFICVDGSLLVGEDTDEKITNVKEKCSSVINTFFSEYKETNNRIPPTAIIVTKYDLCEHDTDPEELCEIIEEAFSPFFIKSSDDIKRIVTIIPVSIGENILDNDCGGKLRPVNIHLPIFMGIWFALNDKIAAYDEKMQKTKKANNLMMIAQSMSKEFIQDAIEIINNNFNKSPNKNFRKMNKIDHSSYEVKSAQKKNDDETARMEAVLNVMRDNSDKLLAELNRIPFIYINSERRNSFSDALE